MTDDLLGNDTGESVVDGTDDSHDATPDETAPTPDAAATASPDPGGTEASGTDEDADSSSATTSAWGRWRERRRNRVSKWDRPPDPKDWRFFVGTLGKVLIATGILMFGFVAYQLWGTGIETARAQNALEDTFEAAVAANQADDEADRARDETVDEPVDEPDQPLVTTPTDETENDETETGETETENDETGTGETETEEPVDAEPATGVGGGTPSEVVPGGVDLSDDAVVQNVPIVTPGEAIAKLEIPRIGIENLFVVQGVKLDDLKKGPGHYPDTPLPGQLGNASIAGHRTTYGAPFFDVDQLEAGDEIIVTMITGDRFVYSVTGSQVVSAADSWVIGTRDPSVAELTLTTCHPKYTARDRLVIHSVLVPEQSAPVGQAEFWDAGTREVAAEADDDATETADADRPAGDDPTFDSGDGAAGATTADDETDETADDETDEAADDDGADVAFLDPTPDTDAGADDEASTEAETTADDEAAAGAGPEGDEDAVAVVDPDDAEIDAFSEGWFDDEDAWPQIALWGSVLTIISLLAYQLSKKTRHDSIGFMVGIFPFLIALYFFFQNVNRLLPPGL